MLVHVYAGDLIMLMIPFTKIAHCVLMPLSQLVTSIAWKFPAGAGDRVAGDTGLFGPARLDAQSEAFNRVGGIGTGHERRWQEMKAAILTDTTKCIGCHQCIVACKKVNHLENDVPRRWDSDDGLSARNWTSHHWRSGQQIRAQAMPALPGPACAAACPVGALHKTEIGAVIYDSSKCLGCRYCMMACPFGIPRYDWNSLVPYVRKCILCYDRIKSGGQPACTEICPTKATIFGDRDELLAEAHRRIAEGQGKYLNRVWGESEVGGTSVLYISDIDLSFLTYGEHFGSKPLPATTRVAMEAVPFTFLGVGAAMAGLCWIIGRRMKLQGSKQMKTEARGGIDGKGWAAEADSLDARGASRRCRHGAFPFRTWSDHSPVRCHALGFVGRLRCYGRRGAGSGRICCHRHGLHLPAGKISLHRAARRPDRLPWLCRCSGGPDVRSRTSLEHLAHDDLLESALAAVRGRLVRDALSHRVDAGVLPRACGRVLRPGPRAPLPDQAAPPLVIVGIALSTLHQSSLGSLFLIMPYRLHPLVVLTHSAGAFLRIGGRPGADDGDFRKPLHLLSLSQETRNRIAGPAGRRGALGFDPLSGACGLATWRFADNCTTWRAGNGK